jgi:tetratricopeptide (TPR) repeat protein
VFWLYSRGLALVARGKTSDAEALQKQLATIEATAPRDEVFMPPVENHSWQIFHIANTVLAARIAAARGNKPDAIRLLRDAVAAQDQLLYDEPPDWYYPIRESLGGMLVQVGDLKGAETVFRDDLERNPRNPRSLFGLAEVLTRLNRTYEASWVKQQFEDAWEGADLDLKFGDL